eukprot:gb/GEZN01012969.1/.p1 GENE.gb/GEZN01012969.1/~~gb/GEZN01012969.1/.p1  ORF type:complete len:282 (-),score=60.99 gb/GEZN01012969.1/:115-960(-)
MSKREEQEPKKKRSRFYLVKLLPELVKELQTTVREPNTQIGHLQLDPGDLSTMTLVLAKPSPKFPVEVIFNRREDPNKMMVFGELHTGQPGTTAFSSSSSSSSVSGLPAVGSGPFLNKEINYKGFVEQLMHTSFNRNDPRYKNMLTQRQAKAETKTFHIKRLEESSVGKGSKGRYVGAAEIKRIEHQQFVQRRKEQEANRPSKRLKVAEEEDLDHMIFALFDKKAQYSFQELDDELQQPRTFLKTKLAELCSYDATTKLYVLKDVHRLSTTQRTQPAVKPE